MSKRKVSPTTEARRAVAMQRLAVWTSIVPPPSNLVAHLADHGFKTVARVAMVATARHSFTLGDTGPVPKLTLATVAANALRSLPADDARDVLYAAFTGLEQPRLDVVTASLLNARLKDGEVNSPLTLPGRHAPVATPAPRLVPDAPVPIPAPGIGEVMAAARAADPAAVPVEVPIPAQTPVAAAVAEVVAGGDSASAAGKVAKTRRAKGVAPTVHSPEWEEAASRNVAMKARPEANWQPASVVFGMRNLKGYVEVVGSSHANVPAVDPDFVFNRPIMERVVAALSGGQGAIPLHLWCHGERGTGKTTLVEQIAARLGRPLFKVTFTRHTDASEIIGQTGLKDGSTYWTDGSILSALRCDEAPIILLDEFTLAQAGNISGPINEIVHSLCKYHIPQTGEVVRYDPRTWFVVGDNTNGSGDATGRYTDTRQANRATVDRFAAFVRINRLSNEEEVRLIAARASVDETLASRTQEVLRVLREKCDSGALADPPSMREAIAFASLMRSGLLKPDDAFESAFAAKYPPEAQEEMRGTFTATWKPDPAEGAAVSHPLNTVEPDDAA